jgi:acyl-CoA thioester hydrolase
MVANVFSHPHRVIYADCTLGNHVYHARYLDLLEAARGEFFRHLGPTFLDWQEQDVIFPVLEARLRYQSPARYDDVVQTAVWVTIVQRIRLNFAYRMVNQNQDVILEAETFHVCTAREGKKPKRLPTALIALLIPHLRVAGSGPGCDDFPQPLV